jgi:hypothetical protein
MKHCLHSECVFMAWYWNTGTAFCCRILVWSKMENIVPTSYAANNGAAQPKIRTLFLSSRTERFALLADPLNLQPTRTTISILACMLLFVFLAYLRPRIWRQYVAPKCRWTYIGLHGVIFNWVNIVTWSLKAGIVDQVETSIAGQQLGNQVSSATDTQATIEKLLRTMFSVRPVRSGYKRKELVNWCSVSESCSNVSMLLRRDVSART